MELGDYLSKGFSTAFKPKPYLSALFVTIVVGLIFGVGIFAFVASMSAKIMATLGPQLTAGQISNPLLALNIFNSIGIGTLVGMGIFFLIVMIIELMGYAFVFKKIQNNEENKTESFFSGFDSAIVKGLKLFVSMLIYTIIICITFTIVWLITLIPYLGPVLGIILGIILLLYYTCGLFVLYGFTFTSGISKGVTMALVLPLKKIHLIGYSLIAMLILCAIGLVLGVIMMIPIIGWIVYILGLPIILVFFVSMAYNLAKEEI